MTNDGRSGDKAKDRRERIAIAALQGMLASRDKIDPPWSSQSHASAQVLSNYAVRYADALIEELDREDER